MVYEEQQIRTKEVKRVDTPAEGQITDKRDTNENVVWREKIVYLIYSILAGLLALRFVLSLLGANRSNAFADFIYTITVPLVAPFRGLFNIDTTYGVSRFDIESLIAIIVYGLIAWVIAKVLDLAIKNNATV